MVAAGVRMIAPSTNLDAEWLEADGSGGFASGTIGGERTRRYHATLLTATTPPTGRLVLVNGFEAWIDGAAETFPLTSQRYQLDVVYPEGWVHLAAFNRDYWPTWTFALPDGSGIEHEVVVHRDACETVLRWRRTSGRGVCRLRVRLLLSGRDYHAMHRENADFRFDAQSSGGNVCWRPYPSIPAITALTNGVYDHAPEWYRNFLYVAERDRGLDDCEDLASPGILSFELTDDHVATIVLRAGDGIFGHAASYGKMLIESERARRTAAVSILSHSAGGYRVERDRGETLVAGFPWFTDWGRDTFIGMRGLVLDSGDLDAAESILVAWAGTISMGMLPNRFPDRGDTPEYNSVDASLWFIVVVHEFLERCEAAGKPAPNCTQERLNAACQAVLEGYTAGTRFGIQADHDGLLRAGIPGLQLTWMDVKIGDRVVTPRIGKPVEVQALWINALRIAAVRWSPRWRAAADVANRAFAERFVIPGGGLYDVVDVDHVPGACDASVRPNQVLAVGGLPFPLLKGAAARAVVDVVEARLLTPLGLRSLAPDDPAYIGRYRGDPATRDGAYHQGTVWPWLMGPFVDAWLAVRGRSSSAKHEARERFLAPLMAHLDHAGLGHVSEVADGDPPHTPGGCPFQAWSLGELIRVRRMLDVHG
jgi:predicted glycogen debranching enzyme